MLKQIYNDNATDPDNGVKKVHTVSTLLLRIRRFRLNFFVILFLNGGLERSVGYRNAVIPTKIDDLIVALKIAK